MATLYLLGILLALALGVAAISFLVNAVFHPVVTLFNISALLAKLAAAYVIILMLLHWWVRNAFPPFTLWLASGGCIAVYVIIRAVARRVL